SALDMMTAVRNTAATLGVDVAEAVRMASTYPADFLGLTSQGRIAPQKRAAFVIADHALRVREVVICTNGGTPPLFGAARPRDAVTGTIGIAAAQATGVLRRAVESVREDAIG